MGHIGAGGVDAHFRNQAGGRNPNRQKRFTRQDPDMEITPMLNRSDSFSSFTGKHASFSKGNVANRHGDDQIVCKREAFYVVEVQHTADMLDLGCEAGIQLLCLVKITSSSQKERYVCVAAT